MKILSYPTIESDPFNPERVIRTPGKGRCEYCGRVHDTGQGRDISCPCGATYNASGQTLCAATFWQDTIDEEPGVGGMY